MTIKAVVFDLGGTLIEYAGEYGVWPDLETPGFKAAHTFLAEQGLPMPSFDQFKQEGFALLPQRWEEAVNGSKNLRLVEMLGEALRNTGAPAVSAERMAEAGTRYEDAICSQSAMIANAGQVLTEIKARGYKIGLLSNTMFTGRAHKRDLSRFGLLDYFDAMLFSADAGKWKPTAAPFLEVMDQLGVEGETAVYIGDSPLHDVVGGQRAGMKTIHFESSQRFENPDHVQPDAVIHALPDLLTTLDNWK